MNKSGLGKRWLLGGIFITIGLFLSGHLTMALLTSLFVLAANAYIDTVNEKDFP